MKLLELAVATHGHGPRSRSRPDGTRSLPTTLETLTLTRTDAHGPDGTRSLPTTLKIVLVEVRVYSSRHTPCAVLEVSAKRDREFR